MEFKVLEFAGFKSAMHSMRNPKDSWSKNDSTDIMNGMGLGPNDKELTLRLQKAGPEHAKHLRQIMVWVDIRAPRFWWTEFDTYRIGVEKNSCSTMHKLMDRPLALTDFECETEAELALESVIRALNARMENYKELMKSGATLEAKEIWRSIIQLLPQSYLQKRTVMISYAALRNIIRQRRGHKLAEWAQFIEWCKTLPEAKVLLFDDD